MNRRPEIRSTDLISKESRCAARVSCVPSGPEISYLLARGSETSGQTKFDSRLFGLRGLTAVNMHRHACTVG